MERSIEALSIVLSTTYDQLDYYSNNYSNNKFTEYKQGIKNSKKLIF